MPQAAAANYSLISNRGTCHRRRRARNATNSLISCGFRSRGQQAHCIKDSILLDFACGTGGFITSWLKELKKQHWQQDTVRVGAV